MRHSVSTVGLLLILAAGVRGAENVMITDVPDYSWHAGCFGTAGGNLLGYWDRNGFPNFYTGPTADGVAPLNSAGSNRGIRSMWASKAGFDGRPEDQPGHVDDYWTYLVNDFNYSYESTEPDPYVLAGRPEHAPDCLGDFIGASQNKWSDLDGECAGNIDAYAFNFWDKTGAMRVNFTPPPLNGEPVRDVQSGLRAWTRHRGYAASTSSQLADVNPDTPAGRGFGFADLRREILRGYPVILMLQNPADFSRSLPGMARGNPNIHAMLAHRFVVMDDGRQFVQYRTSWASGETSETWAEWGPQVWAAGLALRGVILYHPRPQITGFERDGRQVTIRWDGPLSMLYDEVNFLHRPAHLYVVQRAATLNGVFADVSEPVAAREATVSELDGGQAFYRLKLLTPAEESQPF